MKGETHEVAVFPTMKIQQIIGAATSGSCKIVKALNKLASSKTNKKSSNKGVQTLSLNKRLLATIKEPLPDEHYQESLSEQFQAPSLTMSINETACSATPPKCPRRHVSIDVSAMNESLFFDSIMQENGKDQDEQRLSGAHYDRFVDETTPCDKAPPSKPSKRASIDYGFRDSMASTISAVTMGTSLEDSFLSDDEDGFFVDMEE